MSINFDMICTAQDIVICLFHSSYYPFIRLFFVFDWFSQKTIPFDIFKGDWKPSLKNFNYAIDKIEKQWNCQKNQILHVFQSLYHDCVPAKKIGLTTVWINRRHGLQGLMHCTFSDLINIALHTVVGVRFDIWKLYVRSLGTGATPSTSPLDDSTPDWTFNSLAEFVEFHKKAQSQRIQTNWNENMWSELYRWKTLDPSKERDSTWNRTLHCHHKQLCWLGLSLVFPQVTKKHIFYFAVRTFISEFCRCSRSLLLQGKFSFLILFLLGSNQTRFCVWVDVKHCLTS